MDMITGYSAPTSRFGSRTNPINTWTDAVGHGARTMRLEADVVTR